METEINPFDELDIRFEVQLVITNETGDYKGKVWTLPVTASQALQLRVVLPK